MKKLFLLLACLLLPTIAWAFPDNAVLETFTGSNDVTPPNAPLTNWTNKWTSGAVDMRIRSNGITTVTSGSAGTAYWSAATFGANCEAYATIVGVSGTSPTGTVGCRLVDVGAETTEGYSVSWIKASNRVGIYKRVNGVGVLLGALIVKTVAIGDSFGIRTVGSSICAWYKVGAGAWSELSCREDSSYSAGGAIGIGVNGDSTIAQLDNFGGGTVTPGCTGASPTLATTDVSQQAVKDCIALAITGDTVNIPAGSATWTTTVSATPSVNLNKGITLHGETVCSGSPTTCVDSTIINDGTATTANSDPLWITGTNARVTGISFKDPRVIVTQADVDPKPEVTISCANCRFDHNSIIDAVQASTGQTHGVNVFTKTDSSTLIDHNYFKDLNGAVNPDGTLSGTDTNAAPNYNGSFSWRTPMTLGDANAVYIEDNNFDFTAGTVLNGAFDSYAGARLVFRFNTVTNTNTGGHGLDSGGFRSVLRQEVYHNTYTNLGTAISQRWVSRGGTFLMFYNTISASGGSYNAFITLQNYRSSSTGSGWGICDGTQAKDQNTTAQEGYACRDQVGRGPSSVTDAQTDWPIVTTPPSPSVTFSQPLVPGYSWGNLFKGAQPTSANVGITDHTGTAGTRVTTFHILNNRDFYVEVPSFTGAAGTGTGTHAQRLALSGCTTGVAFWETDTGEWDSTNGATADGRLFTCTSTDTWTLYYTPYTYPHPLQAATVTAPTGLRLMTQPSANSACLVWGVSDMADLAGYRIYHGTSSGVYDPAVSIPINSVNTRHMPDTQYCYASHVGGTHYFSMTAYNSDIVESSLATEVSATFTALNRNAASARSGAGAR